MRKSEGGGGGGTAAAAEIGGLVEHDDDDGTFAPGTLPLFLGGLLFRRTVSMNRSTKGSAVLWKMRLAIIIYHGVTSVAMTESVQITTAMVVETMRRSRVETYEDVFERRIRLLLFIVVIVVS
jgi:hypothetical protein